MSKEKTDTVFSGDPRKLGSKNLNEDLNAVVKELNFPFVKELVCAFLGSTDPNSWLVGEMGMVGDVKNPDIWAVMRLYQSCGKFHLDIYRARIEQLQKLELLTRTDWDNGYIHPALEITAGPQETGAFYTGKGPEERYGVSLKFNQIYGIRFPDPINEWILGFASRLGHDYAQQYDGSFIDQPTHFPYADKDPDLELFHQSRQIYASKKKDLN